MMIRILRTGAGIVIGYAVMVVLITLVQETWFGGVSVSKSSIGVLVAAGLLTALAAAIGSVAATAIARPLGRIAAAVMACVVVLETIVLVTTGRVSGPLWFDLMGAGSLIVSILVGAEVLLRLVPWWRASQAA
jgi:hypothetical protein